MEEADRVGDLAGEAHLVGGDQHRHPLRLEVADSCQDLADQLRVEGAGDLVEQQGARAARRGRGRSRPAAAGRRRGWSGRSVLAAGEAEAGQQLAAALLGLPARHARARAPAPRMTFSSTRQVREEVVGLEDEAEPAADRDRVDARGR